MELKEAITIAATDWTQLGPGDPNTFDLFWLAGGVKRRLGLELPRTLPAKDKGVALVDLVEREFICSTLIRTISPSLVAERGLNLLAAIGAADIEAGNPKQRLVAALYTWHGCINMAKLLRPTYVLPGGGEAAYEKRKRFEGYDYLSEHWSQEMAQGNPWIRYGVSLARQLEINRKQEDFSRMVIEDWVPLDSPYWEA
jgi:hypothetical protein